MLKDPIIHESCFIAPTATVVGDVTLDKKTSVYYGAVLRGDEGAIVIGEGTNVQDGVIIHEETQVGRGCTVGHNAILHACTVGDNTLVGMGAIVLNGAVVGDNCIIGAGALVTGGTVIPDGMMVLGAPAKVRRPLTEEEINGNRRSAAIYEHLRQEYKEKYQ